MINQAPQPKYNLDPGGMGHDTDEGTDSEHEGTGPYNERNPLRVSMAQTLMQIYRGEIPFMRLDPGDNPDAGEPEGGGDIILPVECSPDGKDPSSQGESSQPNADGSTHITVYDTVSNDRISGEESADGTSQSDIHYTNQNVGKGEDGRH